VERRDSWDKSLSLTSETSETFVSPSACPSVVSVVLCLNLDGGGQLVDYDYDEPS
jgi:hypothetical protein